MGDYIIPTYWNLEMRAFGTVPPDTDSLWLIGALWCQGYWLTLVQLMACCLTVPSYQRDQCQLTTKEVLWNTFQGNVYLYTEHVNPRLCLKLGITAISYRGQWVQLYLCIISTLSAEKCFKISSVILNDLVSSHEFTESHIDSQLMHWRRMLYHVAFTMAAICRLSAHVQGWQNIIHFSICICYNNINLWSWFLERVCLWYGIVVRSDRDWCKVTCMGYSRNLIEVSTLNVNDVRREYTIGDCFTGARGLSSRWNLVMDK